MDTVLGLVATLVAVVALVVSLYGVKDFRNQIEGLLRVERNRAYTKVLNDMVWEFVEPTEKAHKVEIAKGMHEFCTLAEVLDPKRTVDISQTTVNNEALWMASELVKNGSATWKGDYDVEKVKQVLHSWQTEKNAVHIQSLFGKKSSLF